MKIAAVKISEEVNPADSMIAAGVGPSNVNDEVDEGDMTDADTNESAIDDLGNVYYKCQSVFNSSQATVTQSTTDVQFKGHTMNCLKCGRAGKLSTVREKGMNTLKLGTHWGLVT